MTRRGGNKETSGEENERKVKGERERGKERMKAWREEERRQQEKGVQEWAKGEERIKSKGERNGAKGNKWEGEARKGREREERKQGDKRWGGREESGAEIQLKINWAMLFLPLPLCQEPNCIVANLKMAVTADTDTRLSVQRVGSATQRDWSETLYSHVDYPH